MKKASHLKHESLGKLQIHNQSVFYKNDFYINYIEFHENVIDSYSIFERSAQSDFFAVLFVEEGNIQLKINGRNVEGGKNSLIFFSPGHFKQVLDCKQDSRLILITFTANFFKDFDVFANLTDFIEYFFAKSMCAWLLKDDERLMLLNNIEYLRHRITTVNSHVYGKEVLYNVFLTFLYDIANLEARSDIIPSLEFGRKEELVLKFFRLVENNCKAERKIGFYADKICVSAKYLSETLKEITGKTAGDIIGEMNVSEAKRLLMDPGKSISDVSNLLNFSSLSFFSKFFKRITGLSPLEYKKSLDR